MLIVGLTGSIGTGKSTAAKRFGEQSIAVFDADAEVHALYHGEAAPLIEAAFPGTVSNGEVDRSKLAAALGSSSEGFARLEAIVHPLVRQRERQFLHNEFAKGSRMAVLEVPLLFETGLNAEVDIVVVTSAEPDVQRARVLARPGMTADRLAALLARQVPDAEKRRRAHFVVDTNGPLDACARQIDAIINAIEGRPAKAYQAHWV
jgi:dephospho-CoA kinase